MVTAFTSYLMFADTLPVFRGGYYSLVINRLTEQSGGLRKEGRVFSHACMTPTQYLCLQ